MPRLTREETAIKQAVEDLGGDANYYKGGGRLVIPFDAYDADHIDDVLRDTGYWVFEAQVKRNRKIDGVMHAKVMVVELVDYDPEEDN